MKRKTSDTKHPASGYPNEIKYSIIVPIELDEKMQKICKIKKYNRSMLLRELMDKYLDRFLQESQENSSTAGGLLIHLNEDTEKLLVSVSHDSNIPHSAVVQLLVTRGLPAFVEETRSFRAQSTALLENKEHEAKNVIRSSTNPVDPPAQPAKKGKRKRG